MAEQKNLRVIFTDKADLILVEILKKYGLHENQEVVFNKLKKDKLPNEIKMQRMVEYFGKNIITQKEFNEALAKVFNINSSLAQTISNDVVKNLVPKLEIHPEEKFNDPIFREEVSKKVFEEESIEKTPKEILLEKIKRGTPITNQGLLIEKLKQSIPDDEIEKPKVVVHGEISKSNGVKKVEVEDVEESAENLKKQREETSHSGTTSGELQRKGQTDKYREATD